MKVIVIEPGKAPEVRELDENKDLLRQLQKLVGGYIEAAIRMPLRKRPHTELVVYCNEEGLLQDLPLNCYRPTDRHPLVGTLVMAHTDDEGNEIELDGLDLKLAMSFARNMTGRTAP